MSTIIAQADDYAKRNASDTRQAWIDGYNAGMKKRSGKKELDLSFVQDDYMDVMDAWINYKKERKQAYTQRGIEVCFHKLYEMSNGDPQLAAQIVGQSMANNWAGLFELKNGYGFSNKQSRDAGNHPNIFDVANKILQKNQ